MSIARRCRDTTRKFSFDAIWIGPRPHRAVPDGSDFLLFCRDDLPVDVTQRIATLVPTKIARTRISLHRRAEDDYREAEVIP
jgi:hypothetical protein